MRAPLWFLVALLATGAFLPACSGPAATGEPAPTPTDIPSFLTPTATPPATESTPSTPLAPDFLFSLYQGEEVLGGRELRFSDLLGRPIVLNFWARLCTPCWSEMPEFQDFYEEYGQRVTLLGLDVGEYTGFGSRRDASKLLSNLGIAYPAGFTDDSEIVRKYQVRAMPTTVFITGDGEVFRTWTGSINRESVTAIVERMLKGE